MLGRRRRYSVFDKPPYKRRQINLIRPAGYRTNQAWQDWRAMKYIAARPIPPVPSRNIRTGGYTGKELKFVDQSLAAAAIGTTWTLMDPATGALNAVAQGNGESERIGRRITNVSLHIRGWVSVNNGDADANLIRVCVVRDTQTNGAAADIDDLFDTSIANEHAFDVFNNLDNKGRFKTLMDKYINLDGIAPTYSADTKFYQAGQMKEFKKTIPLNLPVTFTGTDGTIGTIRTNNIGCFVFCNSFGGTTDATQRKFAYRFRLRFTDY